MIAFLSDVFAQTRTHLNDDDASTWTDPRLLPKMKIAFDELQAELVLAGIPIVKTTSVVLTVPLLVADGTNLDLTAVTNYPTDLLLPIWLKERSVGQSQADFSDMIPCDFIPQIAKDTALTYWSWQGQKIYLRGALQDNEVMIRYQKFLTTPGVNTDSVIVILGQMFLAPRIASLAMESTGSPLAEAKQALAFSNLDKIIRINIKQGQALPTKRRPYHRGHQAAMGFRNI